MGKDVGEPGTVAYSVQQSSDRGYVFVGTVIYETAGFPDYLWVIKRDELGSVELSMREWKRL